MTTTTPTGPRPDPEPTAPTPAASTTTTTLQLNHRQILTVLAGLMLGMLVAALSQTIVATALPTIVGELGGQDQLSWVVSATLLASTASTPLWGKLSDLYGRKIMVQSAIGIFLVASLACGFAQDMPQLIGFRALQGLGIGGLMALSQAILGDVVSPRERGRYQGYLGSVFALATVAGPLLGGVLVEQLALHRLEGEDVVEQPEHVAGLVDRTRSDDVRSHDLSSRACHGVGFLP